MVNCRPYDCVRLGVNGVVSPVRFQKDEKIF